MLNAHLHISRPLRSHENPQTLPGSLSILGESLLSQNSPRLPTSLHVCLSIFSYFLTIPHNLCSLFVWTHNTVLFPGSEEGNGCIYPTDHVMLWSRCFMGKALTGTLLRVKEGLFQQLCQETGFTGTVPGKLGIMIILWKEGRKK